MKGRATLPQSQQTRNDISVLSHYVFERVNCGQFPAYAQGGFKQSRRKLPLPKNIRIQYRDECVNTFECNQCVQRLMQTDVR